MSATRYDVVGIGNAIVDVLSHSDDDFLARQKMPKGSMSLIDEKRAEAIYNAMGPVIECSGGSAANTIVGVAMLGGKAAFIGKVKDDELGHTFARDIRASGVAYTTPLATEGPSTARCYILVTPDGQRTMNTYLGAAQDLSPGDISSDEIRSAKVLYLEGYLWDPKQAKEAFVKAAGIAHESGRTVALTLSDAFCVDRYRKEFLLLIRNKTVDLLFANEAELKSLYETGDFDAAVEALRKDAGIAVVTRSEKGAMVVTKDTIDAVPAFPASANSCAAGFLYGFANDMPHTNSLKLGALCAAEIISHIGARPAKNLRDLASESGLLK